MLEWQRDGDAEAVSASTSTVPCDCCAPQTGFGTCGAECSTRAGTATLVGYSEFTGFISSPPKKYLIKGFAGSLTGITYSPGGGCAVISGGSKVSYAGVNSWDPATNTETQGSLATCSTGGAPFEVDTLEQGIVGCGPIGTSNVTTAAISESIFLGSPVSNLTGGGCIIDTPYEGTWPGDSATCNLSSQDTEAAAIARNGATFGAFQGGACCSFIEPRSGFAFSFQEAKVRVVVTGWGKVKLRILYNRGIFPGSTLLFYGYEEHLLTLSKDKSITASQTIITPVPNAYGFVTCFGGCQVWPADPEK